jgi:hypothetical protein
MNSPIRMRAEPSEAAKAFVGQSLRLRVTEFDYPPIGMVKQYELDDPEMEARLLALASEVRIFPPGSGGTMNFRPFRLNFSVDEHGVITQAYMG